MKKDHFRRNPRFVTSEEASRLNGSTEGVFLPYGKYYAESPTSLDQSSTTTTQMVWRGHNGSSTAPNFVRSDAYLNLVEAITVMSRLPVEHDFHVDREVALKASDILAVMYENFDISPPKVMSQEGDAVVFTWDYGDLKRYLTIDADEWDVMDLHKKLRMRCVHECEGEGREQIHELISVIGAHPFSSSTQD